MTLHPMKIELSQIARSPASAVASMLRELEGLRENRLSEKRWPIFFKAAAFGGKKAPFRR